MHSNLTVKLKEAKLAAKTLAQSLKGGEIFALKGQLGAGKTTFTQFLAKELRIKKRVSSPTFVLMNQFVGKLPSSKRKIILYHLDLYRTKNFKEVSALGIKEFWGNENSITVIEWGDKIKKFLPKHAQIISFI
jgi:tRNA threonylcarbamoyladenosine biosynthesis protein TsaE